MILAYIVARVMESERWAFVADATLYLAAAVTIATAAFGIISKECSPCTMISPHVKRDRHGNRRARYSGSVLRWLTERRRSHLLEHPFPDAWKTILEHNVAAYASFDVEEQQRLRDLVQVFVAEKHWEGAGGLELTDEIRVTIAGTGCQLLIHRDHDLFADVRSIVVYPSTVVMPARARSTWDPGTVPSEGETPALGMAQRGGALVLAWDAARRGARDPRDGRNVVIHELAHKIDFLDGAADGTPPLADREARREWARAFEPAFLAQRARAARGETSLLSDYAITNEAEYFAVATEMFFEKPCALAAELPEIYARLREFFRVDPGAGKRITPGR